MPSDIGQAPHDPSQASEFDEAAPDTAVDLDIEGGEEVGAPTPQDIEAPGGDAEIGAPPQPEKDETLARDTEDALGAGDLGEGVEDFEDDAETPSTDRKLDKGLKETFPASDPVSINPGAD